MFDERSRLDNNPGVAAMGCKPDAIVFDGCFGWYHPGSANLGVVLCAPHGYEELCVHRQWRELAVRLSEQDLPTLRYDYPGTGDSADDDEAPHRVRAWLDSISDAVGTLRRISGVERVALVGLRMGAMLALAAAEQMDGLAALVLLAPIGSGKTCFRELRALTMLRALERQGHSDTITQAGGLEAAGFIYTPETINDLRALLPLRSGRAPAEKILVLNRPHAAADKNFLARLRTCGASVEEHLFADYPPLVRDADLSVYPHAGFGRVVDWLAGLRGITRNNRPAKIFSTALRLPDADERPVFFRPCPALFGVMCEPRAGAHGPVLVFLNTGSIHHIGSSRMTVTMARRLARMGFTSLRLDIGGIGESDAPPRRSANHPSNPAVVADVVCALDWLRAQGHAEVVLVGLCSGAKLALETTLRDERVVAQVLLNLQGYWASADAGTRHDTRRGVNAAEETRSASIAAFRGLAARHVKTRFIYVKKDPGLDELEIEFDRGGQMLSAVPKISIKILDEGDHVFSRDSSRRQLLAVVEDTLKMIVAPRGVAPLLPDNIVPIEP